MFSQEDLQQIAGHGLTPGAVERQIADFRRGFPFLRVVRAASPGDGVAVLDERTGTEGGAIDADELVGVGGVSTAL